MNLYEHTIIARQDTSPSELKQLTEKYSKIVEKNEGEVVKTENWGLLNLSYLIKKNKKGSYIHFKIKGKGKVVEELEKNVWQYQSDVETHTVETHIYRLRKKILQSFNDQNFILSEKNGYQIK